MRAKCHVCDFSYFKCTWSFSLSINVHAQNIGTKKFAKKVLREFRYWKCEKLRKFRYWAKKRSFEKARICSRPDIPSPPKRKLSEHNSETSPDSFDFRSKSGLSVNCYDEQEL